MGIESKFDFLSKMWYNSQNLGLTKFWSVWDEVNIMTIEELYELMKQGFDRIENRLESIDSRLRNVETDVAELKGRRLAFKEWIPIGCAVIAVIVSIIALVKS